MLSHIQITTHMKTPAVTTFVLSAIVSHEHKLDMVHVQNSTLAGGVAVGSVCNLLIGPHGAVLIGIVAGLISVLGYRYLSVSNSLQILHLSVKNVDSLLLSTVCIRIYCFKIVFLSHYNINLIARTIYA